MLHFRAGQLADARALVKRFHYSGRFPNSIKFIGTLHLGGGLFGDFGEAVAACVFTVPPTRWREEVLELSRLVRREDTRVPLTMLIRLSCAKLKAAGHDLLVSFADRTAGHHGGVYQAAGWRYHGRGDRSCDGVVVGGRFVPGRSCNSTWGTRSPEKLTALLHQDVQPHYDEGKHLYWRALGPAGERKAERLELRRTQYPKEPKQ